MNQYMLSSSATICPAPRSVCWVSTRPKNCLAAAGISTVGELMELSDDQLLALPNMGVTAVREIQTRLKKLVFRRMR